MQLLSPQVPQAIRVPAKARTPWTAAGAPHKQLALQGSSGPTCQAIPSRRRTQRGGLLGRMPAVRPRNDVSRRAAGGGRASTSAKAASTISVGGRRYAILGASSKRLSLALRDRWHKGVCERQVSYTIKLRVEYCSRTEPRRLTPTPVYTRRPPRRGARGAPTRTPPSVPTTSSTAASGPPSPKRCRAGPQSGSGSATWTT